MCKTSSSKYSHCEESWWSGGRGYKMGPEWCCVARSEYSRHGIRQWAENSSVEPETCCADELMEILIDLRSLCWTSVETMSVLAQTS